jgi:hypothetical protein
MIAKKPTGTAAQALAEAFRRHDAPQPMLRMLRKSALLVTEFMSDRPDVVLSATLPRDNAYVVTLHLRDRPKGAMAAEGRWIQPENFHAGNAGIVDLHEAGLGVPGPGGWTRLKVSCNCLRDR